MNNLCKNNNWHKIRSSAPERHEEYLFILSKFKQKKTKSIWIANLLTCLFNMIMNLNKGPTHSKN